MAMSSRTLEVTVISGEGLRVGPNWPVKKNAYAIVRTDSKTARTTKVDGHGGSFPAWNEKLVMDLPVQSQFLTVEVQCRSGSGDRVVGAARIPVAEFAGGYIPENYLHFLSYRLRDRNGERNGIINLSVTVKAGGNCGGAANWAAPSGYSSQPWVGFPAEGRVSSGIVTGVPVWHRY